MKVVTKEWSIAEKISRLLKIQCSNHWAKEWLFGSVVSALDIYPDRPGPNPTLGGIFFRYASFLCYDFHVVRTPPPPVVFLLTVDSSLVAILCPCVGGVTCEVCFFIVCSLSPFHLAPRAPRLISCTLLFYSRFIAKRMEVIWLSLNLPASNSSSHLTYKK